MYNGIQCVGTVNASDYRERTEAIPWFGKYFRAVYVRSLDQEATLRVLLARKSGLESFHQVTYAAEALEFAVNFSGSYLPERSLPGKAVELLDAAGSLVKLRQAAPPEEVAEAEKRLKFIAQRLEGAIVNHEFEKARYYSDEEREETGKPRCPKGEAPSQCPVSCRSRPGRDRTSDIPLVGLPILPIVPSIRERKAVASTRPGKEPR